MSTSGNRHHHVEPLSISNQILTPSSSSSISRTPLSISSTSASSLRSSTKYTPSSRTHSTPHSANAALATPTSTAEHSTSPLAAPPSTSSRPSLHVAMPSKRSHSHAHAHAQPQPTASLLSSSPNSDTLSLSPISHPSARLNEGLSPNASSPPSRTLVSPQAARDRLSRTSPFISMQRQPSNRKPLLIKSGHDPSAVAPVINGGTVQHSTSKLTSPPSTSKPLILPSPVRSHDVASKERDITLDQAVALDSVTGKKQHIKVVNWHAELYDDDDEAVAFLAQKMARANLLKQGTKSPDASTNHSHSTLSYIPSEKFIVQSTQHLPQHDKTSISLENSVSSPTSSVLLSRSTQKATTGKSSILDQVSNGHSSASTKAIEIAPADVANARFPIKTRSSASSSATRAFVPTVSAATALPSKTGTVNPSKTSLTPAETLRNPALVAMLTPFEQSEILEFSSIYFVGALPLSGKIHGVPYGAHNFGYDDERGDYKITLHDHLEYRYEVVGTLGKGSFGSVVKCLDHKKDMMVALKVIRNKRRFHHQAIVEVKILEHLMALDREHRSHIVRVFGYFYFRNHLCIAFEPLAMNLYEFIKCNMFQGVSLGLIRRFATQLLMALSFLASQRIMSAQYTQHISLFLIIR